MFRRNIFRRCTAFATCLTLAAFLSACGARSNSGSGGGLIRTPQQAATARVDRAVQDAAQYTHTDTWHTLLVRYNPSYCDSPPWEAHLYGAWRRIALEPTPDDSTQDLRHLALRPTGNTIERRDGWNYAEFEWRVVE